MSTAGLVPGWPLAVFRIAFGLLYLDMAFRKAPWKDYGWLRGFIAEEIQHPTFGFVAAFLQNVVLPNFALFGMLTFVTEFGLGLGAPDGDAHAAGGARRLPLAGEYRAPGLQRARRVVLDLAAPHAAPVHVRCMRGRSPASSRQGSGPAGLERRPSPHVRPRAT